MCIFSDSIKNNNALCLKKTIWKMTFLQPYVLYLFECNVHSCIMHTPNFQLKISIKFCFTFS